MKRLLIANRGEIALRIARTARALGLETVAVFSDADAGAPHVRFADYAVRVGAAPPSESYANVDAVLRAAETSGADAVHPGYGFLAESPAFAERCEAAGLTFVGPSAASMRALGNKGNSKRLLANVAVPLVPGYHDADQSDAALSSAAERLGYPLMIKASSGGGGRGMRLVTDGAHFLDALRSARSEATAAFGDGDVLLERALIAPRHVEVQIFGDACGNVVHLGERDCSVQRRHQKIIEEAPSPAVDADLRARLGAAAVSVARAASYVGAGTVEFLLDASGAFYFIEMNTRLQVEHPVTEAIARVDLVEWQLRVARGEPLPLGQAAISFRGHAIEARLCAEDPALDFLPQTGTLVAWIPPAGVRVEHALEPGIAVSPYYDSMIAKVVAYGDTREDARARLTLALEGLVALGLPTNRSALLAYLRDERFVAGDVTTRFIEEAGPLRFDATEPPAAIVALAAGLTFALAAEAGDFGPLAAWSSSNAPVTTLALSFGNGPTRAIALEPHGAHDVTVTAGGRSHRIAFAEIDASGGRARYRLDDGAWQSVALARRAATTFVSCDDRTYEFTDRANEPAASASSAALGDGFLRAPMSGRVVSISTAGEVASAGAQLVVLEAMKMEHVLSLPVDVVLRDVTAVAGMQVHANDILLAYEPAAAG